MVARVLRGEKLGQGMACLEAMVEYEKEYNACIYICDIDEAGRGLLTGPVAAGAVMLPRGCHILYLDDSKKPSERRHEELSLEIKGKTVAWSVGLASSARTDEINILQATHEVMKGIVKGLSVKPEVFLDDATVIPGLEGVQVSIIKEGAKSLSIVAANIPVKVTRDHIMTEYEELFPGYGFAKHKGYGMVVHIVTIREFGPYPIHRRSFIRNIAQVDTYE